MILREKFIQPMKIRKWTSEFSLAQPSWQNDVPKLPTDEAEVISEANLLKGECAA